MVTKTEGLTESDIVVHEMDKRMSRETETIASGEGVLQPGAVLGRVTATNKLVLSPPASVAGKEGAETAIAVLLEKVDASAADAKGVTMRRLGLVNRANLSFEAAVDTANERQAKVDQLEAVFILARQGA